MPERRKAGGGRDAFSAADESMRRFYLEALAVERATAPDAPMERLPPRQNEAGRFRRPAPSWSRAILANIGFAACFLIIASASLSNARTNPGYLSRQFVEAYEDGRLRANAEYVARGINRAFEFYRSEKGPVKDRNALLNRYRY